MTLMQQFRYFNQQLQTIYPAGEAATITDWVFQKTVGLQRSQLLVQANDSVDAEIGKILQLQLQQLLQHRPVQYVLEEAWFDGLKFEVNESVLIPRPETEELVALASKFAAPNNSVLEIGTGSGCIAIALQKRLPQATIMAIDISEQALQIARRNGQQLQAPVKFEEINFLAESGWDAMDQFHLIVSNPPYIPLQEKMDMDVHVTGYEPHLALFVPDQQPLLFYQAIAKFGRTHLQEGGTILVEIHENYGPATATLFETCQYRNVQIHNDLLGKQRMVSAHY